MVQMAATNTLIQIMVPDHLRGRVMAVHIMMFMGMAPFGSFLPALWPKKWVRLWQFRWVRFFAW